MAAQAGDDPLDRLNRGDLDRAIQKHAKDSVDLGFVSLPGGINNGVARLTRCYFATVEQGDHKGKPYFRAVGVVVSPESVMVDGTAMKVAGLQTSVMVGLYERKSEDKVTTFEEAVSNCLNEIRKLGVDTSTMKGGSDLRAFAAALEKAKPYFRFTTRSGKPSQKYPTPRVFEQWLGRIDPSTTNGQTAQSSQVREHDDSGSESASGNQTSTRPPAQDTQVATSSGSGSQSEQGAFSEFDDLDSLGARANAGDAESQQKLEAHAMSLGFNQTEIEQVDSWDDMVALIKMRANQQEKQANDNKGDTDTETEPDDQSDDQDEVNIKVNVGLHCKYQVKGEDGKPVANKRTGKPVAPATCEVTAVDQKGKTCDLRDLASNKTYKKVPFTDLQAG